MILGYVWLIFSKATFLDSPTSMTNPEMAHSELGGKAMRKFSGLRARSYSYLTDEGSEDKKQTTQKSV